MWTEKILGKIRDFCVHISYPVLTWEVHRKKSNIYTHLNDIRYKKTRRDQELHLLAYLPASGMGWWDAAARVSVCVDNHNTRYSDREF